MFCWVVCREVQFVKRALWGLCVFFYGPGSATQGTPAEENLADAEEPQSGDGQEGDGNAWGDLFRLAGVASVDPLELQFWQILEMAYGSRPELLNENRTRSGNPNETKIPLTKDTIGALKVFL